MRRRIVGAFVVLLATIAASLVTATGAQAVDDGVYYKIVNNRSRACVDVRTQDGINNDGAHLQNYRCNDTDNKRWRFVPVAEQGYYHIVNKASGKCMDVRGAWTNTGVDVWQWTCADVPQQKWRLIHTDDFPPAAFQLQVMHSGQCLELPGGNGDNGVALWQNNCSAWYAQWWELVR
jgi:Ricin-type beta-trefoil lectin domain-like